MITLILLILIALFFIVGDWLIFTKAGEAGWKSIIPLYNSYVMAKFSCKSANPFWGQLAASLISGIIMGIANINGTTSSAIITLLIIICGVANLYFTFKLYQGLAYSFGKSTFFAVMTIFFSPITFLILGYGKAKYVGKSNVDVDLPFME